MKELSTFLLNSTEYIFDDLKLIALTLQPYSETYKDIFKYTMEPLRENSC